MIDSDDPADPVPLHGGARWRVAVADEVDSAGEWPGSAHPAVVVHEVLMQEEVDGLGSLATPPPRPPRLLFRGELCKQAETTILVSKSQHLKQISWLCHLRYFVNSIFITKNSSFSAGKPYFQ